MPVDVESQGMEFKRDVQNFRDISKTACAFANAFGGRIMVGISDDDKGYGVPDKHIVMTRTFYPNLG